MKSTKKQLPQSGLSPSDFLRGGFKEPKSVVTIQKQPGFELTQENYKFHAKINQDELSNQKSRTTVMSKSGQLTTMQSEIDRLGTLLMVIISE